MPCAAIYTVDQSLLAMVALLAPRQGVPPFATAEIETILQGQVAAGGEFRNLSILNAAGRLIYSSNSEDPKVNLADRSFFLIHRDNPLRRPRHIRIDRQPDRARLVHQPQPTSQ